jgi:hypothetical protein
MRFRSLMGVTVLLTGLFLVTSTEAASASESRSGSSPAPSRPSTSVPNARGSLPRGSVGIRPDTYFSIVISSIGPNLVPDPSDRVVDLENWSKADRGRVHMWDYRVTGDVRNQRWDFFELPAGSGWYQIVNNSSGKCLDESLDGGSFNGQIVYQFECGVGVNQLWAVIAGGAGGHVRLMSAQDNRCLDIRDKIDANDATLQVWSCNSNGWNQSWYLTAG